MRISFTTYLWVLLCLLISFSGCGKKNDAPQQGEDVLVSVGDSSLTVSQVVSRIPVGLNSEDSLKLFNRIVDEWVRDLVLADYAEKNITDLNRIEQMVAAYRNNLIVNQYLQSMSEAAKNDVSEDRIRRFYDASHESMILEQPIVKGIYLKVSENDESLPNIRKWMASLSDADIDHIEKSGLRQASQYKYFKDEWVEWNAIADQIPYRFQDPDKFVKTTTNFEFEEGGSVYLLSITEFVESGNEMPYEFAKVKIAEILQKSDVANYRKKLIDDIYRRQMKEGVLKPGLYNPLGVLLQPGKPASKPLTLQSSFSPATTLSAKNNIT